MVKAWKMAGAECRSLRGGNANGPGHGPKAPDGGWPRARHPAGYNEPDEAKHEPRSPRGRFGA